MGDSEGLCAACKRGWGPGRQASNGLFAGRASGPAFERRRGRRGGGTGAAQPDAGDQGRSQRAGRVYHFESFWTFGLAGQKDEEDAGLTTHLETINRADDILPEVSRAAYPAEVEVVYRPDIKIGQTVLIKEEDLGV